MPLSGRPGDVLDEQLHLAHLLLPPHRPLVEEPGEHLEAGTIRRGGTAQKLLASEVIREAYLGV